MAIDTVVEEVADNLQEVAEATRKINTTAVSYFTAGMAFGFLVGFYWGYKFNKEKIRAEAFKKSEEEVQRIRETYHQKTLAATPKPSVEEVLEEKGYTVEVERPLKPPVVIYDGRKDRDPREKVEDDWDWPTEMESRLNEESYVIHQDEYSRNETGYSQAVFTYYSGDDTFADESDSEIPNGHDLVGEKNLRWGHGSDDADVVFVRNDTHHIEMEVCRIRKSYEQEVLGLEQHDEEN